MDEPQSKQATEAVFASAPTIDGANSAIDNAVKVKAASTKEQPPQPSPPPQDEITKKPSGSSSSHGPDDHSSDDISESSDITDVAIANPAADYGQGFYEVDDMNAAPGHLHALSRISDARLRGLPRHNSDGKLAGGGSSDGGSRRRSRSTNGRTSGRRSANSSRSSSPLRRSGRSAGASVGGGGETGSKAGSSLYSLPNTNRGAAVGDASSTAYSTIGGHSVASGQLSSLDGIYDPDVLLDRLGFIDLDPPLPHEIRCGPLAAPGALDGKSNNSGGLTPVNERLSEETLDDCHAFNDLVMIDNLKHVSGGMSSTLSMPSVAHSSLSGMRSDMSVGSGLSLGSFKGGHSRGGSVAGGSLMGDGENSVLLGTLDEEGEDEYVDC